MTNIQLPKDLKLEIEFSGDLEMNFNWGKFYFSHSTSTFYFIQTTICLYIEAIKGIYIIRQLYNTYEDIGILHLLDEKNTDCFEPYRQELIKTKNNMIMKSNEKNSKMIYSGGL